LQNVLLAHWLLKAGAQDFDLLKFPSAAVRWAISLRRSAKAGLLKGD